MVIDQEPREGRIKKGGSIKLIVAMSVSQPQTNIIVLGHKDHGKTTLVSAITKVLSDIGRSTFVSYETLVNFPQRQAEFKTTRFSYRLLDFPDNEDILNFLNDQNNKAAAAILVVSAVDGPMPQVVEQLARAKEKGISLMVIFINKADLATDRELRELVGLEVRELLNRQGFDGSNTPIIYGSALGALQGDAQWRQTVLNLVKSIEEYVEPRLR
jgi:elongation factor Tu